mgnify:CR=1 FL=1
MNPLIKWPGGKSGEIKKIEGLIPKFNRYIEPFFGGGALFFHLKPRPAIINDISRSLIEFYRLIKKQDKTLHDLLMCYSSGFGEIQNLCTQHYDEILAVFEEAKSCPDKDKLRFQTARVSEGILDRLGSEFYGRLILSKEAFAEIVVKSVSDKISRTVSNNAKRLFSGEDLKNNLITGYTRGFYTYFRKVFNDLNLGRIKSPSLQYKAANFYFIREYCYGSMFRYNRAGEFNIPYGGMSYNRKSMKAKIENMFNCKTEAVFRNTEIECEDFEEFLKKKDPTAGDFIFLDPPYDTEFSDYEGKSFTREDQERLANVLRRTKAMFILVIKNTEFIRDLYEKDFNILSFDNKYTYNVRSRNDRSAKHLIITNLPV